MYYKIPTEIWHIIALNEFTPILRYKSIFNRLLNRSMPWSPRVVTVRWLAHALLVREARVRFAPEGGHRGRVFSGFPSLSRWVPGWYLYKLRSYMTLPQIGHAVYLPVLRLHLALNIITPLFASQSLITSPFHSDYKYFKKCFNRYTSYFFIVFTSCSRKWY